MKKTSYKDFPEWLILFLLKAVNQLLEKSSSGLLPDVTDVSSILKHGGRCQDGPLFLSLELADQELLSSKLRLQKDFNALKN